MSDPTRRKRGAEMMEQVYAGSVAIPPEGASAFADLMLEQVFAEVWTREALSVRDRRLLIMGFTKPLGIKPSFLRSLMARLPSRLLNFPPPSAPIIGRWANSGTLCPRSSKIRTCLKVFDK